MASILIKVVGFLDALASILTIVSASRPETDQIFFGLCDLGLGFPELGYVCLTDLQEARGRLGLPIERDLSFEPKKNLLEYAHDATKEGRIIS